jgi:hypothetical protein
MMNSTCASTVVRYAEDKVSALYTSEQFIMCWKFPAVSDLHIILMENNTCYSLYHSLKLKVE